MSLDAELAGKVVIVTGAASGIGARTVERILAAGGSVVAVDRVATARPATLNAVFDVTDEDGWRALAAQVVERFGRIDGLVNCAGVIRMGAVVDLSLADFRTVMAVNVEGVFLGMKYVLPAMLAAASGAVVNLSSTAGIAGAAGAGAYCASKGAVRMLSKSAALEAIAAGGHVRVNSLHPAMTETPMVADIVRQLGGDAAIEDQMRALQPSGNFIPADAVVDGILFLLSDRSVFMNGTELIVDNGFTAQ
ncbi:SDR family oxidoreductase [Sphingosinicellaceae bacterium]|nr:SDR family oxidoreductase [Sphingosinicellaceae bacterium]